MLSYCDFAEQESWTTESGRLRPDLVVKLPGGKHVVSGCQDAAAGLSGMPSKPPTKMRGGRAWPIMRGRCAIT